MATNEIQGNLFGDTNIVPENPLKGRRVGFIGKFKNRAALVRKVKEVYGASEKSNDNLTRDTQILVFGSDVKQNDLNRLACYEHDGWHPLCITVEQLQEIFDGHNGEYMTPEIAQKCINIDLSYYNWIPPVVEDEEDAKASMRCSSPLIYGEQNSIYGLEMFVPDIPDVNMNVFRQIIGNLGGYANTEYYDETNVILLGDDTLRKLEQGVKDETIRYIEDKYNNGSSPMFNVQFTSESDFIAWVRKRVEKFNDESTKALLDIYEASKRNLI